jgi:hypothetical protein
MAIHKISSALLNFEDILRILRESYQLEKTQLGNLH